MQPHIESVVKAENQDVPHGTVQACDHRAQTRGQKDKSLCQREAHGCESLARLLHTDTPVGSHHLASFNFRFVRQGFTWIRMVSNTRSSCCGS